MTAPDKPSDVERAVAECRDGLKPRYTTWDSTTLTRPLKRDSLETLIASHERLRLEVERLRGLIAACDKPWGSGLDPMGDLLTEARAIRESAPAEPMRCPHGNPPGTARDCACREPEDR